MFSIDTKLNIILACTVFLMSTVLAGVYGYYQQKKTIDDIVHLISLAKQLLNDIQDVKEKVGEKVGDVKERAKTIGEQARKVRKAVGHIL
tara:strand:- start:1765 stop:2034 length:270 start_codon:yes stop_codon:yes gene_type:complete